MSVLRSLFPPCRLSRFARHTSHVTRHTSHVTRHTSHVTRHTSQGGRSNCHRWNVDIGHQRGRCEWRGCSIFRGEGRGGHCATFAPRLFKVPYCWTRRLLPPQVVCVLILFCFVFEVCFRSIHSLPHRHTREINIQKAP